MKRNVHRSENGHSQRDCAPIHGDVFFYSYPRETVAIARFLNDLTSEVAGSEEKPREKHSKQVAKR